MTTIQDRIIKDFKEKFSTTWIKTKYSQIGINPNDNGKSWLVNPDEVEQFLTKSIKEVEEETRKEILKVIKENHTIEVNNHSDLHLIGNFSGLKHNLSITNKEKQNV